MGNFFNDITGGSILSGAIGMIGGKLADNRNFANQGKLMDKQQEYNKEMAEINQKNAKEMAEINQGYAMDMANKSHQMNRDMWDYTNYENQVKHLEAAGLNPALLYGGAGGGGATASGGSASAGSGNAGSGSSGGSPQAIKSQMFEGMAAATQLGLLDAEKRKLNADADKAEAEANKTKTIDTDVAKATKELMKAQASRENMNTEESAAKVKMYGDASQKMWQEARSIAIDNDIKEATKDAKIEQIGYECFGAFLNNIETIAKINLTEKQTEAIGKNIAIAWYNALTHRQSVEQDATRIQQELLKITGELDIKDKQIIQQYILGTINSVVEAVSVGGALAKGLKMAKLATKGVKKRTQHWKGNKETGGTMETIEEFWNGD